MPERTYTISLTEGQLKALVDSQPFAYNQLNRERQIYVQNRTPHDNSRAPAGWIWEDAWSVILEAVDQAFTDDHKGGAR